MNFKQLDWQKFENSTSTTISGEKQKAPWNANKSAKLEAFIKGWGERLGQPNYKKELLEEMLVRIISIPLEMDQAKKWMLYTRIQV